MSLPLAVASGIWLKDVPVLDCLPVLVELPEVDACHVEGLVVRVGCDQVALSDHAIDLDVDRPDGPEEVLHRLEAPAGPGVHNFMCLIHPWMQTTVTVD